MAQNQPSLFPQSNDPTNEPSRKPQKARKNLSFVLPTGLGLGFILILWFLFGDRLLPARSVQTETVVAVASRGNENTGEEGSDPWESSVLFQASGWIEPDPYPVRATALTSGVVSGVYVLEGEEVKSGQLLATLIDDDARIALSNAEARLAEARATLGITEARREAAEATLRSRESQVESARARLAELMDDADRLDRIGSEAVSAGEIRRAALRVEAQEAILNARIAETEEWRAQLTALTAAVLEASHRVEAARSVREEKQLALDRTRIESPVSGLVQRLLAAPGQKKMLAMDNPESATIAVLFEPDSLQARIDVPLELAAGLSLGQPVWLRSNLLPEERFKGKVTRIVGEADLQRNTLQAKVALLETDPRLRPEMLCRAEFLAGIGPVSGETESSALPSKEAHLQIFAPLKALTERNDQTAGAWIVSPDDQTIRKVQVVLGTEGMDGFVQVTEGLLAGQELILNPPPDLRNGERVQTVSPE